MGKLFKRGGKKGRKEAKGKKKRRKGGGKEEKNTRAKKGKWKEKKDDFATLRFRELIQIGHGWDWEGFQNRWNNMHPWLFSYVNCDPYFFISTGLFFNMH